MADSPRLEELRRRVQSDPASIAFAALAEEYRRAGKFREAVEASRAGLRYHPTYVSARVTLGRSLVELQEVEQAERELTFVLKSAPDNLAARRALGELCWQQLRFGDALLHFRTAHTLAPADAELPNILQSLERELAADRNGSNGKAVDGKSEVQTEVKPEVETEAQTEPQAPAEPQVEPPPAAATPAVAPVEHTAPEQAATKETKDTERTKDATPEPPKAAVSEREAPEEAASADVTFEEVSFHHTKGEEAAAAAAATATATASPIVEEPV